MHTARQIWSGLRFKLGTIVATTGFAAGALGGFGILFVDAKETNMFVGALIMIVAGSLFMCLGLLVAPEIVDLARTK